MTGGSVRRLPAAFASVAVGVTAGAGALIPLGAPPASATTTQLVGTFDIAPGVCNGGQVTGSFFRMILQGGNANGPFLSNSDSTCSDQSYTPMAPGTDGGLSTGTYQPQPSPAFDGSGNALAKRIIAPAVFYGVRYSASTQPTDPQTSKAVPAPEITLSGTTLSGSVQAVSVSWNNQYFNQGSPKPDGGFSGDTSPVTGTYDPGTRSYTLQWTSQIVGGPFNGFSGLWHLTGRFVPASGPVGSSSPAPGAAAAGTPSNRVGQYSTPSYATGARPAQSAPGAGPAAASSTSGPSDVGAASTGAPQPPATPASGDHVLLTKVVTTNGLGFPAWLVGVLMAAGILAIGGFVATERRIRALATEPAQSTPEDLR